MIALLNTGITARICTTLETSGNISNPIAFLVFSEARYFLTNCSCMSVNLKKNDGVVSQERVALPF